MSMLGMDFFFKKKSAYELRISDWSSDVVASDLQVTDMSNETIEVRLLMTARNSGDLIDLRCAIREGMLAWIRGEMPEALVRRRTLQIGSAPRRERVCRSV